jgi:hypothetical protein
VCEGFEQIAIWTSRLTWNRNATVPVIEQPVGELLLSEGMCRTRVCLEQRTDLYETWRCRRAV